MYRSLFPIPLIFSRFRSYNYFSKLPIPVRPLNSETFGSSTYLFFWSLDLLFLCHCRVPLSRFPVRLPRPSDAGLSTPLQPSSTRPCPLARDGLFQKYYRGRIKGLRPEPAVFWTRRAGLGPRSESRRPGPRRRP